MSRLTWIRSHPAASFFLLALAVNYALLIPVLYMRDSMEQPLVAVFGLYAPRLAVYSPVLVAMVLSRWLDPDRSRASGRTRWTVFAIVWLLAVVVFALENRTQAEELDDVGFAALFVLAAPAALLPAFVVSAAFSRITGVRQFLSTLVRPKGHVGWYLVALFTFPLLYVSGQVITQFVSREPLFANIQLSSEVLTATFVTFAFVFFYSGGINEEGGWRGFGQKYLQRNYSPLTANLLLYLYLVVWHIPNDIVQYAEGGYVRIRIALYPFIVILFGWVYNRTGGSILAPALFHASMNSMNTLQDAIPGTTIGLILLVLFAAFAVVSDRMWKRLPADQTRADDVSGRLAVAGSRVPSS